MTATEEEDSWPLIESREVVEKFLNQLLESLTTGDPGEIWIAEDGLSASMSFEGGIVRLTKCPNGGAALSLDGQNIHLPHRSAEILMGSMVHRERLQYVARERARRTRVLTITRDSAQGASPSDDQDTVQLAMKILDYWNG